LHVDYGEIDEKEEPTLYILPNELTEEHIPRLSVEVVVAGLQPKGEKWHKYLLSE
jgi:hypothetical protein